MAIYKVKNARQVGGGDPILVPGDLLFGGEYFVDEGGVQCRFQVYDEVGADKGMMHLPRAWVEANVDISLEEPTRTWDGKLVEGPQEKALLTKLRERGPAVERPAVPVAPSSSAAARDQSSAHATRDFKKDYLAVLEELSSTGKDDGRVDYASVGTDPTTYLNRFPKEMRDGLQSGKKTRVVLHRQALGPEQQRVVKLVEDAKAKAASSEAMVLPCGADNPAYVPIPSGKFNYPAKYYSVEAGDTTEYHLFGLDGESWVIKTLYMLAHSRVHPDQLVIAEDGFDIAACVNTTLDESIDAITGCAGLESLTIGSVGVLMQGVLQLAVESDAYDQLTAKHRLDELGRRLATEKKKADAFNGKAVRPQVVAALEKLIADDKLLAHRVALQSALAELPAEPGAVDIAALGGICGGALLKTGAKPAIASAAGALQTAQLDDQIRRLEAIRADAGTDTTKWNAAGQDPQLASAPSFKAAGEQSPPLHVVEKELAPRSKLGEGAADDKIPSVLRVNGKCHMMISVTEVHGDLCYWMVRRVLQRFPNAAINFQGTCGSVTDAVPKGSMVIPSSIVNLEPGMKFSAPVAVKNDASKGAIDAALGGDSPLICTGLHGNNCTMLQEYSEGIDQMKARGINTVDMESYFVAKAYQDGGGTGGLRIILQVADVASSKEHSQQSATRQREDPAIYARKAKAIAEQLKLK
jgi:hypothetical protein